MLYYKYRDQTYRRGIPVVEVARIMKKDQQFVWQAMFKGILPVGFAFMKEESKQYDYYISTQLFMSIWARV